MKFIIVLTTLAAIAYALPKPDEMYSTKYDTVDIDEALKNERIVNSYIGCLDGTGKCAPDAAEMKKNMKEAIETCCAKCSEYQKNGMSKVLNHISIIKPEKIEEIKKKYDIHPVKCDNFSALQ